MDSSAIVVTGAGGRLGRLVAERLVAAGRPVAALDLAAPAVGGALGLAADAADEAQMATAWGVAEAALGPVSGLVHAVGAWGGGPLAETSLEAWEGLMRVNLTSAFVAAREAVRRMRAAERGGRVVLVASGQGADRGVAGQAAYSAAKAGVIRLAEALHAEHAGHGIAAVAVAPSLLLFGDEPAGTRGVEAAAIAELCVRLCGPEGAVHGGATLRAYGTTAG